MDTIEKLLDRALPEGCTEKESLLSQIYAELGVAVPPSTLRSWERVGYEPGTTFSLGGRLGKVTIFVAPKKYEIITILNGRDSGLDLASAITKAQKEHSSKMLAEMARFCNILRLIYEYWICDKQEEACFETIQKLMNPVAGNHDKIHKELIELEKLQSKSNETINTKINFGNSEPQWKELLDIIDYEEYYEKIITSIAKELIRSTDDETIRKNSLKILAFGENSYIPNEDKLEWVTPFCGLARS